MTIALDLRCGVSGDMLLGAFMDIYSREGDVEKVLERIERAASVMAPTRVRMVEVERSGVLGKDISVDWDPLPMNSVPGTAMKEYLGSGLKTISANDRIVRKTNRMLDNILEAEMVAHGCGTLEEVHLHETGSPDTLVDIIGISLVYDLLEMDGEWLKATPISLGMGAVETSHGTLPVPVPAVRHMIRSIPVRAGPVEGELATPTGVAAVSAIVELWMDHSEKGDTEPFKGKLLGAGSGKRVYNGFSNMLSIWEVE